MPCLFLILKSRHLIRTGKLLALLVFFLLAHCKVYGCLISNAGLETFCWFFTRKIKGNQDLIGRGALGRKVCLVALAGSSQVCAFLGPLC